jgi:hypothetical protein
MLVLSLDIYVHIVMSAYAYMSIYTRALNAYTLQFELWASGLSQPSIK